MVDLIRGLFSSGTFIPHGHCYLWKPTLVWLHILSDSTIALAYYSIPVTLFEFVKRRKDLPFNWVFILFAAFITACGTSHLMSIWTLWYPTYWLSGSVKAITALVSLGTAIALWVLMPAALAIPSSAQLEAANGALQQEIAWRKRVEKELTRNQDLREAVFHESTDALFLVDPQTILTIDCNRRAVELFQADDPTDLIGIQGNTLQRYQFSQEDLGAINSEIQSQGFWSREIEYVTHQDNFFWGNIAAKPITVAGRNLNLIRVTDISDRKRIEAEREQVEQALKISEARYRGIVEDQTELISRFAPDSTILFVNGAFCRYFDIQPEEIIGKSYMPVVFEDDQEVIAQSIHSMSADNPTVTVETRVVIRGEVRWTQWISRMLFDEQGQFLEFQSVGRDISDRKRIEIALRESERRYATLAETSPVAICRFDIDGNCIYVNNRWEEMMGQPIQSALGCGWSEPVHPQDRDRVLSEWSQVIKAGRPNQGETRIMRPDESIAWVYYQTIPETDLSSTPIGYVGTVTNITARKQVEEKLQASLREKEVLLKEIHHRVKNNLQIVYSLLRLQRRQLRDQQAANALLESQSRIESIALIHEKLYQSEDLARINLAEYIPSLVANLFSTYNINQTQIAMTIEVAPIFLDLDKALRYGLIINELLSNSLKYAFPNLDQGDPRIYIKLFPTIEDSTITLIVGDTGVGFPSHIDLSQIETLGLQLVQGFVGQLKGTLQAHCQSGAEFQIVFPGEEL